MNNQNNEEIIKGGLLPLKKDGRDFSLLKVFGSIRDASEIPNTDFEVAQPIAIKDQRDTDFCVAFASCEVSEDQEKTLLSPEWFFMEMKRLSGDWASWGGDLRDGAKVAVNLGFIKKEDNPFPLEEKERDFIANPKNWEDRKLELTEKAKTHKKLSYFAVDGYYDTFDNFRAALWQNRNDNCSILTGTTWRQGWTLCPGGIIPKTETKPLVGHALKFFGQKTINGELYLMAQSSNGSDFGDKGIYYFPREVVNRDFTYGAFMFKDMPQEVAKQLTWSKTRQVWEKIKKVLLKIILYLTKRPNEF